MLRRWLLQILVLLSFFPYPSVYDLGSTTGLELSQILAAVIVVISATVVIRSRSFAAYMVLVLPIGISLAVLATFASSTVSSLALRVAVASALALLILPASGALMRSTPYSALVTPVSVAVLVHVFVGALQIAAFAKGSFPFPELFNNPSFANIQDNLQEYVTYVKRPFGLFPEPSAMAASIGPWIVFLLAWALKDGREHPRRRRLAMVAAILGSGLVLFSRSTYAPFLVLALLTVLVIFRARSARRLSVSEFLLWLGAIVVGIALPTIAAGRLDIQNNQSTQYRFETLVSGLSLPFRDAGSLLFGLGPGQSASALHSDNSQLRAIVSVAATAFTEGGVVALVAMLIVVGMIVRRRRDSPYTLVFLGSWLVGVCLTTGYLALGSIWVFLAFMIETGSNENRAPDPNTSARWRGAPTHFPNRRADDPRNPARNRYSDVRKLP